MTAPVPRRVRIGTRGSRLALTQAEGIRRDLERKNPGLKASLVVVRTMGDEFQSVELFRENGGVGVFTKAIERELLAGRIDAAVHSLKDLPTTLPKGLILAAVPRRLDTADVLVSARRYTLRSLPAGSVVGTGSPRRKRQLTRLRPDVTVKDMRGNLDTRIGKALKRDGFDAVIVAKAGLLRLKRYLKHASTLAPKLFLPAVGQAALAVQARGADKPTLAALRRLNHAPSEARAVAERSFLRRLEGGCRVPAGIHSRLSGGKLKLRAAVFSPLDDSEVSADITAPASHPDRAGRILADKLLAKGARRFLKEARGSS